MGPCINQDSILEVESLGLMWNKALIARIWPRVIVGSGSSVCGRLPLFFGPEVSVAESQEEKTNVKGESKDKPERAGRMVWIPLLPPISNSDDAAIWQETLRSNMHLAWEFEKLKGCGPGFCCMLARTASGFTADLYEPRKCMAQCQPSKLTCGRWFAFAYYSHLNFSCGQS